MKKTIVIVSLLLVGCATPTYRHPDYTPQKWSQDRYACEKDARQSGYYGSGLVGAINMQSFFDRCLESLGWTKTYQ